ncbi:MAG TPA: tetratricopeptide repeat protein [Candidatus Binatia bacterium]|nr:tetratricopeptide repeat protein [Candidatus Binatia bacterium]
MVTQEEKQVPAWTSTQAYVMAGIFLLLGLALGYFFRGSKSQATAPAVSAAAPQPAAPTPGMSEHPMPTLDQMKQMADAKAAPMLEQVKKDPKNPALLIQVAKIYEATHQFKEAANYFGKSLEIDPKDVPTRTEMASCLYYDGDADGAIKQLQRGLQDKPNDANSLFNLGFIRWKGKNDAAGAISTWQQLLKSNPQLESEKKAQVQALISEAGQPHTAK